MLADREKKIRAVMTAMMDLASQSAVAKERAMFMDLVKTEISRLNDTLASKSSLKSMVFGTSGLRVQGVDEGREGEAGGAEGQEEDGAASSRLKLRVNKMLTRLEKEIDTVENKIGTSLQVWGGGGVNEIGISLQGMRGGGGERDERKLAGRGGGGGGRLGRACLLALERGRWKCSDCKGKCAQVDMH